MYEEPTSADSTGDPAVDEALQRLRGIESRPVHEHAAAIEQVHQALQDRLADEPADADHIDDSGE